MAKAASNLVIERTPRTLLCCLEHNIVSGKDKRRTINLLLGKYQHLSNIDQTRLEVYVLSEGGIALRKKLGEIVTRAHGRKLIDGTP